MTNETQKSPAAADTPSTEEMSWTALYGRIRMLAYRRSAAIARDGEVDEEKYDRCARALRTLMGAAEIAARMKREDEKEQDGNATGQEPVITDERIREFKRKIEKRIDRIEREDAERAKGAEGPHSEESDPCGGETRMGGPGMGVGGT